MKCPKCAYLGFETTERCRNCGYDFSLSVNVEPSSELPLRGRTEPEAPLADFDLSGLDTSSAVIEPTSGLDLDRIIGAAEPSEFPLSRRERAEARRGSAEAGRGSAEARKVHVETSAAVATPPSAEVQEQYQPPALAPSEELVPPPAPRVVEGPAPSKVEGLPLFSPDASVVAPRPARPPLAVRRATPEVARRRTPRTIRREDGELALQLDTSSAAAAASRSETLQPAPRTTRAVSALIDLALLAAIDFAVLYLTLAIAGLSFGAVWIVPPIPMGAFFLLLNGGYLIAFTAAHGQTIGKMMTGIRVIGDDGGRVDVMGAVFRTAGIILAFFTLGLPYLPALLADDGRALHDRLAGTRVVKGA